MKPRVDENTIRSTINRTFIRSPLPEVRSLRSTWLVDELTTNLLKAIHLEDANGRAIKQYNRPVRRLKRTLHLEPTAEKRLRRELTQ